MDILLPRLLVCIVNVMAAVSSAVCWLVFAAVWLTTANYDESRAPAQRQRSWYGTGVIPVVIISTVVRRAHTVGQVRARPHVERGTRGQGPYAITGHPSYTGPLGTMLVAGAGPWIAPFPVALILIEFKIRIEERGMTAEVPRGVSALPRAGTAAGPRPPPGNPSPDRDRLAAARGAPRPDATVPTAVRFKQGDHPV